jgi:O-methyltransferase involved in polyketide biosynthesis
MYLSEATVTSVLRSFASLARGSGVAFDYATDPAKLSEAARQVFTTMASRVAAAGEPWALFFDPGRLERSLRDLGFTHVEELNSEAINARYFDRRTDGLRVGSIGRLLHAEV